MNGLPRLLADEVDSYGRAIVERDHARDVACTLEQELAAAEAENKRLREEWQFHVDAGADLFAAREQDSVSLLTPLVALRAIGDELKTIRESISNGRRVSDYGWAIDVALLPVATRLDEFVSEAGEK